MIDPTPFTIPSLGRHYIDQWRELYGYQADQSTAKRTKAASEETMSLRDRLLAMLIEESFVVPESDLSMEDSGDSSENISYESSSSLATADFVRVDERIRQELVSMGFEEFASIKDHQEDDPVCMEMRKLQKMLREQVCRNHYRKRKLADRARSLLAGQEFYALLSDINKQIEHLYHRRTRQAKKKKPKAGESPAPSVMTISSDATKVLETKARLVDGFRDIIPPLATVLASTTERLFDDEQEKEILRMARRSGTWLPIPDSIPLRHCKLSTVVQPVFPVLAGENVQDNTSGG